MERKYDLNTGPKENYVADSPISDSEATLKKRSFVLLFLEISKPLFICKLLVSALFISSFILKYAIVEMIAHVFILHVTKECRKTHFCFNGRKQIRVINFSTRKFAEWLASISLSFNGFTATSLKHAISSGGLRHTNLYRQRLLHCLKSNANHEKDKKTKKLTWKSYNFSRCRENVVSTIPLQFAFQSRKDDCVIVA